MFNRLQAEIPSKDSRIITNSATSGTNAMEFDSPNFWGMNEQQLSSQFLHGGVERQDSLDIALQLMKQEAEATELAKSNAAKNNGPSPPSGDLNGLDYDERFTNDAIDNYFPDFELPADFQIDAITAEKQRNDANSTAVCSPVVVSKQPNSVEAVVEQTVPADGADVEIIEEPTATHVLLPGQRKPISIEDYRKTMVKYEEVDEEEVDEQSPLEDDDQLSPQNWFEGESRRRSLMPIVERVKQEADYVRATPSPSAVSTAGSCLSELPKPRKYHRKNATEKSTSTYVEKRAKNNDAVRRSRAKAKDRQRQMEERMEDLELENTQLKKELKRKDQEIALLKMANLKNGDNGNSSGPAKRRRMV